MLIPIHFITLFAALAASPAQPPASAKLELAGVTLTPHLRLETMRYRREPEPAGGARVQLFLRHPGKPGDASLDIGAGSRLLFGGKSPAELLAARAWTWHDTPAALPGTALALPAGALTVWTFNGRTAPWGPGGRAALEFGPAEGEWLNADLAIAAPEAWISAVTFLAPESAIRPTRILVHLANESGEPLRIRSCRLWLPRDGKAPRALFPQPPFEKLDFFGGGSTVAARDKGGFSSGTAPLPLTYAAVEVGAVRRDGTPFSLWAHLRIKPERFDISGGWVGKQVTSEVFLKALKRLHINTAHLSNTPGYTDTELYPRYPLKYFHRR